MVLGPLFRIESLRKVFMEKAVGIHGARAESVAESLL